MSKVLVELSGLPGWIPDLGRSHHPFDLGYPRLRRVALDGVESHATIVLGVPDKPLRPLGIAERCECSEQQVPRFGKAGKRLCADIDG